jgi:chemotaxis response regulator CheB
LQPIAVRILLADDFRNLVTSMLLKKQELQVVGKASDGLEAVRKVEELKRI